MSHDLKSPLTSIRAYTEALLDGVAKDEAARLRYLQTIHARENDIEAMVNRLFEFAKMDASNCPVRLEPIRLYRVIQEQVGEWDSEGLEIRLQIPDALCVTADRGLLNRIIENLLSNSRKYGGREIVHVCISAGCSDGMAEICFADDGVGAAEEQLGRLFDAFYRGDAARTAPGSGSGLGLAVVKKAVEEMGGSVRAENSVSGGLKIIFTLPIAEVESDA